MDIAIKIGECLVMEACLITVFILLASLTSLKFGLIFKVAKPIFGFLFGLCVGAYLISLFSYEGARIGAILFGIAGAVLASALGNSS